MLHFFASFIFVGLSCRLFFIAMGSVSLKFIADRLSYFLLVLLYVIDLAGDAGH